MPSTETPQTDIEQAVLLDGGVSRWRKDFSGAVDSFPGDRGAMDKSADMLPRIGSTVADRFVIERELGRGGMGVVFAARDLRLGSRPVAIKWLRAGAFGASSAAARLLREALAAIDHPNVVRIHDVDLEHRFLVMELLEGRSLAQRIAEGPLGLHEACDIARQVMAGLAAVHARGLIHRDLKPENIFLARDHQGATVAKVLDFGIVKWSAAPPSQWTETAQGVLLGTPTYMAPEQLRGGALDERVDLYALAVVLYEMLTGRRPFRGATPLELGARVLLGQADKPSRHRHDLPETVEQVVLRGMSMEPADRFQDADSMALALQSAMSTQSLPSARVSLRRLLRASRRSPMLWGGSALIFAALILIAWSGWDDGPVTALSPPPLPAYKAPTVAAPLPLPPLSAPTVEPKLATAPQPATQLATQPATHDNPLQLIDQVANGGLKRFVDDFDRLVVMPGSEPEKSP